MVKTVIRDYSKSFYELTGKTEIEWLIDHSIDLLKELDKDKILSINVNEDANALFIEVRLPEYSHC